MRTEDLIYNMALAQGLRKEALAMALPAVYGLASLGRTLATVPHQHAQQQRAWEFNQKARQLQPGDAAGARRLVQEYQDLPHHVYAQAIGAPVSSVMRQVAPGLVHSPGLALGGAALGSMLGPVGAGAGAVLGGVGSALANRMHNRGLNREALKNVMGRAPGGV